MKSAAYPLALMVLLLAGWATPDRARAQSMYQVDPFAAAAAPFDQLNPAALTTGLLAERANPFMSLYSYSLGLPHHDSLTLSADGLQMATVTAQTMAYDPADAAWLGTNRYTPRRRTVSDTVYLGALLVRHDQLASDALSANLVSLNTTAGKVYDVPGRPRSPYVVQTAVLMAPLTESLTGPNATFYLDSRDLLANVPGAQAVGLRVNGQYFSFGANTGRSYTFPASGTYAVSLQFLVGGTYRWAHANVVVPPPAPQQLQLTGGSFFTVPIDGGGGTLRIQYSGHCGNRLSKTIIFVGGLDPENDRGYLDVTLPKLQYQIQNTNTPYDGPRVIDHLNDNNFDIIFVDWDDGGASLGTNAGVVARAIQTINRLKTEDGDGTPSIIVGQSMGGLCVRAGIHMLDSALVDPRLERFYSWDTPHRGANYPINMQSLIVHFGDNDILRNNVDGIKRAYLAHLADGPRQLRLLSIDIQGDLSTLEFDAWQAYYQSFDISVPHFAMSDGSGTSNQLSATPQANRVVLPGANILSITAKRRTSLVSRTQTVIVAEYLPGNFEISFEMYLFGIRLLDIDLAHNRDIVQGLPNYDIIPASISNVGIGAAAEELPNGTVRPPWYLLLHATPLFAYSVDVALPGKYYAYVPTQSAQNLPISFTPSTSLAGFDTDGGVLSNAESIAPPLAYQGPTASHNHDHVSFTPQLVTFFLDGVLGANLAPIPVEPAGANVAIRYNFGSASTGFSTPDVLAGARSILNGGAILVNNFGRLRDVTNTANPYNDAAPFTLTLGDGNCYGRADIAIQSGGTFRVGDHPRLATVIAAPGSRITVQGGGLLEVDHGSQFLLQSNGPDGAGGIVVESQGTLEVRGGGQVGKIVVDGAILRVKSGGKLSIGYAARVEVINGGRLILEDGASVQFFDQYQPNESDGAVYVGPNGKLELQGSYNWSGPGYLHLNDPRAVAGPGTLRIVGNGRDYRRIRTDAVVTLDAGQGLLLLDLEFLASYGGIAVNGGGRMSVQRCNINGGSMALATDGLAETRVWYNTFDGATTGFGLDNTNPTALARTWVWYCNFVNTTGAAVELYGPSRYASSTQQPWVRECSFNNCDVGVRVIGVRSVRVDLPVFTGYFYHAIEGDDFDHLYVRGGTADGDGMYGTIIDARNGRELILEGGQYTGAEHAVTIQDATLDLRDCVELSGHSVSGIEATSATVILAGATIVDNYLGIHGEYSTIERRLNTAGNRIRNTLGRVLYPAGSSRFFSLRYAPGTIPTVDLSHNGWVQNGAAATPGPDWFCSYETNNYCVQGANTSAPNDGCGTECDSPACPQYCVEYPEDPGCGDENPYPGPWPGPGGPVLGPQRAAGSTSPVLFPNPAREYVVIDNLRQTAVTVQVHTAEGKFVSQTSDESPGTSLELAISSLIAGTYIVTVEQAPENDAEKGASPYRTRHRLAVMK